MDGTITFRAKGEPTFNGSALPFYSVDTERDAELLQATLCKLSYDDRYMFHGFEGTIEDIDRVAEAFFDVENRRSKA